MSGGTANNFTSFPSGTWSWTGTTWQSVAIPTVCFGTSLVWNPQSQQLLNIGRSSCGGDWLSVFALSGTTWVDLNWTEPDLFTLGGVWDDARQEVLAFGPEHYSRRKNGRWQRLASTAPGVRAATASASNLEGELVMFGGETRTTTTTYNDQTWVRDAETGAWRLNPGNTSGTFPPQRSRAVMGYHAPTGTYVLFGGSNATTTFGDTWVYSPASDGTGLWSRPSLPTSPAPRSDATMARDPQSGALVLYGGRNSINLPLSDTWLWDGAAWTQLGGTEPPKRYSHAMATDESSGTILMFGGADPAGPIANRNDLWRYFNGVWTQLVADGAPNALPRITNAKMAYDPIRRCVVLDGGFNNDTFALVAQTWFWNTRLATPAWNQIGTATNGRTARRDHLLFIHPETGEYFTQGGVISTLSNNNMTDQQVIAPSAVAGFITGMSSVPRGQTVRLELFEHPGSAGGPHGFYRWYRDGALLSDGVQVGGEVISGASTRVLTVGAATTGSAGTYQCVYWGAECPTSSGFSEFFRVQVTPATSYLASPDADADRIVLLSTDGTVVNATWIVDANNPSTYDFLEPFEAIQVDGELWVSDTQQGKIFRFTCSQQPQFLGRIDVVSPRGMCYVGGLVYVVSGGSTSGTEIRSFLPSGLPTFSTPIAITGGQDVVPYSNGLMVSDGTNNRLMVYPLTAGSPFRFDAASTLSGPRQIFIGPASTGLGVPNEVWVAAQFGPSRMYRYAIPAGTFVSGYGSGTARGLYVRTAGNYLYTTSSGLFRTSFFPGSPTTLATGNFQCISPLTILPNDGCDEIDFNRDALFPDSGDLDDVIAVLGGGPSACSTFPAPGCGDIDFNNDGLFPDAADLDAFLSRLAGGPCVRP